MNVTEHLVKALHGIAFVEADLEAVTGHMPSGAADRLLTKARSLRDGIAELIKAIDTEAEQDNG